MHQWVWVSGSYHGTASAKQKKLIKLKIKDAIYLKPDDEDDDENDDVDDSLNELKIFENYDITQLLQFWVFINFLNNICRCI